MSRINIPESSSTVSVSIIDTTVRFQQWKIDPFIREPKIRGHDRWTAPSWSFKIVHPTHGTYLFDLGVRLDWEKNMPPKSLAIVKKNGWTWTLAKDVSQILQEQGESLTDIKGIIWSHWHWDHVGNPATFPATTKLIVGPGFRTDILPGWPHDPDGKANADAWKDRTLEELTIPRDLIIGKFASLDYFGDGSFYILDTPGHTIGHICALARTTSQDGSSFIFMGGDVAHLLGQFRPNDLFPLPDIISPDPRRSPDQVESSCPCAGYVAIHPQHAQDKPYYEGNPGMATDVDKAESSTRNLEAFDSDDRIFVVIAHDNKLEGVIDVYPKEANGWRAKGWKKLTHWRFLGDFQLPAES